MAAIAPLLVPNSAIWEKVGYWVHFPFPQTPVLGPVRTDHGRVRGQGSSGMKSAPTSNKTMPPMSINISDVLVFLLSAEINVNIRLEISQFNRHGIKDPWIFN